MKNIDKQQVLAFCGILIIISEVIIIGGRSEKSGPITNPAVIRPAVNATVSAPQSYTNIITVSKVWTRVETPYGWSEVDRWGYAPIDIRVNGDSNRTYPLCKGYNKDIGNDVQFKEFRINPDSNETNAQVTCVFTKVF